MSRTISFILLLITFLIFQETKAQAEGLTSSPYSYYGLGTINQTSIGRYNSMGFSGIGIKSTTDINNLNPANFSLTPRNSFLYDIGIRGTYNSYENASYTESKSSFNFSNIAFAFAISDDLGMGVSMNPYSDVGYSLLGLQTNIEGSTDVFESNVDGVGGLNDLRLNFGFDFNKYVRLGLSTSFLFGNIEESESFTIDSNTFLLEENINYSGLRLGLGLQIDPIKNLTIGSTLEFPVTLNGTLRRSVLKNMDGVDITIEEDQDDDAADFELPLEFGLGMSYKLNDKLLIAADYKMKSWEATNQVENTGEYIDQKIYAFGLEYINNPISSKYFDRVRLRGGFNYDTGYLLVNNEKIDGYGFSFGIGLPTGFRANSLINISYTYGSNGQIQSGLVRENYHLVTFNFSLENLWFVKRRID